MKPHRYWLLLVWLPRSSVGASPDAPASRLDSGRCTLAHEIARHGYVLTPGCSVGAAAVEQDDTSFVERFAGLQETRERQFEKAKRLTGVIRETLAGVMYVN